MQKVLTSCALFFALLTPAFAKDRLYQNGKLIDIATDERLVHGTTARRALFVVQVADIVYTAQGDRIRRRTGDPGKGLVVGDPVRAAIDKDHMVLLEPDGKEMKLLIKKRARVQ